MSCGSVLADAYDAAGGAHAGCLSAAHGGEPKVWLIVVAAVLAIMLVVAFAVRWMLR